MHTGLPARAAGDEAMTARRQPGTPEPGSVAEVNAAQRRRYYALIERLRSWAQNEEMIDARYLQHGRDCIEAANALYCARAEFLQLLCSVQYHDGTATVLTQDVEALGEVVGVDTNAV